MPSAVTQRAPGKAKPKARFCASTALAHDYPHSGGLASESYSIKHAVNNFGPSIKVTAGLYNGRIEYFLPLPPANL